METNPEGTVQTYIFLVDNQDIALNIVMSGYQALCLVQEDDGYYFSADSFIEEMRAIQFTGSCQCAYHYVASCTVKWINDKLLTFFKDAGLDGKAGWQLLKEKEYLGKLDNQKEVEKLLEQYILRFERNPKEEPELSRFHLFDAKGNVKGVRDMEIVDYLVENVRFFVVGITPYYYEHGVFLEDHDGVRMKYRIQKLIYRDQVQSGVIKRIYNLLITQPKVHREAYELNKQPVRWINFKNGYYDPVTGEMLEHNPDYLTINQIPFPYYPDRQRKDDGKRRPCAAGYPDEIRQRIKKRPYLAAFLALQTCFKLFCLFFCLCDILLLCLLNRVPSLLMHKIKDGKQGKMCIRDSFCHTGASTRHHRRIFGARYDGARIFAQHHRARAHCERLGSTHRIHQHNAGICLQQPSQLCRMRR